MYYIQHGPALKTDFDMQISGKSPNAQNMNNLKDTYLCIALLKRNRSNFV
jgi:hypothetical protein